MQRLKSREGFPGSRTWDKAGARKIEPESAEEGQMRWVTDGNERRREESPTVQLHATCNPGLLPKFNFHSLNSHSSSESIPSMVVFKFGHEMYTITGGVYTRIKFSTLIGSISELFATRRPQRYTQKEKFRRPGGFVTSYNLVVTKRSTPQVSRPRKPRNILRVIWHCAGKTSHFMETDFLRFEFEVMAIAILNATVPIFSCWPCPLSRNLGPLHSYQRRCFISAGPTQ